MKAKEYAERYKAAADKKIEIVQIAREFLFEIKTIGEMRHAVTILAFKAIFLEQEQKWVAFVGLTGDPSISPKGFRAYFRHISPELADRLEV